MNIYSPHLDAMQGATERRNESYLSYEERAVQVATPQSAKSLSRVDDSADKQAKAVRL